MDETATRREHIDKQLRLAGWDLDDPSQVSEELGIEVAAGEVAQPAPPTYVEHQFVDYALLHHGRAIAVLEAKRTSRDAKVGREQAIVGPHPAGPRLLGDQ